MAKRGAKRIRDAEQVLAAIGMPRAQQNERSALCLLALLDLKPRTKWSDAMNPLMGITPIMDWIRKNYGRDYAPNTRETFRRQTMHQFVSAGVAIYNPDDPTRPVNSPKAVYQVSPEALDLVRVYGAKAWNDRLSEFVSTNTTLADKYAKARNQHQVPLRLQEGKSVSLSPGEHSELIRAVVEEFGPRFAPESVLVYAGDTGDKWGYFDVALLTSFGITVDSHGKMPDVVLHDVRRNWLLLVEAVTSHGPMDPKRHEELSHLFGATELGLVYVTAFPTRAAMSRYISDIAWETEVWVAEAPSHLIHFDGERFLGPYQS